MNVTVVFQRFMEQSFEDYRDHFVVPYLNDGLVISSDFISHLKHLQLTLQLVRKYDVKIKAKNVSYSEGGAEFKLNCCGRWLQVRLE